MNNELVHEIELYSPESFRILLDHEVNRSRRYGEPLSLIHLVVETDSNSPHAQHGAEIFAINVLNLQVRQTDIPCKKGNEFMVLMPSTDEQGGRIVCKRLEKLFNVEPQDYDKVSFRMFAYIGMASLSADSAVTSRVLTQNASQALDLAREKQLNSPVIFSDIKQIKE